MLNNTLTIVKTVNYKTAI